MALRDPYPRELLNESLERLRYDIGRALGISSGDLAFRLNFYETFVSLIRLWLEVVEEELLDGRDLRMYFHRALNLYPIIERLPREMREKARVWDFPLPSSEEYPLSLRKLKEERFQERHLIFLTLPFQVKGKWLLSRGYRESSDFLIYVEREKEYLSTFNEDKLKPLRARIRKVKPDAIILPFNGKWVYWGWIPLEDTWSPLITDGN